MNNKWANVASWRSINKVLDSSYTSDGLETELSNLFSSLGENVLYFNVGFICRDIFDIYEGLEHIWQKFTNNNANKTNELQNILNELFEEAKKENIFLYNLVQNAGIYEINNSERLQEINGLPEKSKEKLEKIYEKYSPLYLTIYYGNIFVLDCLIIFFNKANASQDEGTINYIKGYLQYLAGFLMYKISNLHALRSAISAIMSRNGSHNIGSHVIYNVIKEIDELNIQDNKYLFKYLQQRMDFVAQISTGWVPDWTSSSWLIKEILKGFCEQAHLLNFIARSEGLAACSEKKKKEFRPVFHSIYKPVRNGNGKLKLIAEFDFSSEDSQNSREDSDSGETHSKRGILSDDILLAIPGGIIGFHAFYTLLENFIRNSAKHGFSTLPKEYQKRKDLRLRLEIEEDLEKQIVNFRMWDNLSYISTTCKTISSFPEEKDVKEIVLKTDCPAVQNKFKIKNEEENGLKVYTLKNGKDDSAKETIEIIFKCKDKAETIPVASKITFIVHPYEHPGDEKSSCRPAVISNYDNLLIKDKVRFIREPRMMNFVYNIPENETDNKKLFESLYRFLADHWVPLHQSINKKLEKDIINSDGSLRRESWGLGEMRICSGYLNRKKVIDVGIGSRTIKDGFFKAVAVPEPENLPDKEVITHKKEPVRAYRLGYEFTVPKPKELLVIGIEDNDLIDNEELKKQSIFVKKPDYINDESSDFDYEMVVFVGEGREKLAKKLKQGNGIKFLERFPYRMLADKEITLNNNHQELVKKRIGIIKENTIHERLESIIQGNKSGNPENAKGLSPAEELKLSLYEQWVNHLITKLQDKNDKIFLNFKITGSETSGNSIEFDKWLTDDYIENHIQYKAYTKYYKNQKDAFKGYVGKIISDRYGVYKKDHIPCTLGRDIFQPKSEDANNHKDFTAKFFNSKLIIKRKIDEKKYHDQSKVISYKRHHPMRCDNQNVDFIYDEAFSGASAYFPIVANIPAEDSFERKKLILKLFENGLLRIAIADERLYDYLAEKSDFAKSLARCRVYPVKTLLDYSEDKGIEKVICLESKDSELVVSDEKNTDFNGLDAIIIHQGILDKIKWDSQVFRDEKEFINKLKEKIPFVIVTSGRGEPDRLPDNVKFIGFSILENYLIADPHSKFILTDVLMKLSMKKRSD